MKRPADVMHSLLVCVLINAVSATTFQVCGEEVTRSWYEIAQYATYGYGTPTTNILVERSMPDCFLQIVAGEAPACMDANWYGSTERAVMYAAVTAANFSGWALEQLECCKAYESSAPSFCKERYSATASIFTSYVNSVVAYAFDCVLGGTETSASKLFVDGTCVAGGSLLEGAAAIANHEKWVAAEGKVRGFWARALQPTVNTGAFWHAARVKPPPLVCVFCCCVLYAVLVLYVLTSPDAKVMSSRLRLALMLLALSLAPVAAASTLPSVAHVKAGDHEADAARSPLWNASMANLVAPTPSPAATETDGLALVSSSHAMRRLAVITAAPSDDLQTVLDGANQTANSAGPKLSAAKQRDAKQEDAVAPRGSEAAAAPADAQTAINTTSPGPGGEHNRTPPIENATALALAVSPRHDSMPSEVSPQLMIARDDELLSSSRVTRRLTQTIVSPGAGTLQAALDSATAGDELVLQDGVYTGSGDNVLEIDMDITIRAENAGQAVLDGSAARRVVKITSGTVVLDVLNITNGRLQDAGCTYSYGDLSCLTMVCKLIHHYSRRTFPDMSASSLALTGGKWHVSVEQPTFVSYPSPRWKKLLDA